VGLDRVTRRLKGEPVCGFDWPGNVPGSRRVCDGIPVGERDGKPACASHLTPYVPAENRPYDDGEQ
jgi:hypothetical protein